jgi:hypothetical protein
VAPASSRPWAEAGRRPALHDAAIAIASQFAILWAGVSALLLIREAIGHVRLRRAQRAWMPAPDALHQSLDWPKDVPLFVAANASPLTAGLLRPRVVIPAELPVARLIARHELSHARWRDPLVYALLRILAALFWIAPVWPLLRWIRRERETAADEMALRGASGDEEQYVAALLQLSRTPHGRLAPAMAESDLEYRAERILLARKSRFSFTAALALALGGTLIALAEPAHFAVPDPIALSSPAFVPADVKTVAPAEIVRVEQRRTTRIAAQKIRVPLIRSLSDFTSLPGTLASLEPQPPPITPAPEQQAIDRHIDRAVDRHVARHVVDDDDEVIRIVIRDRRN